jgi:hypothetical protein
MGQVSPLSSRAGASTSTEVSARPHTAPSSRPAVSPVGAAAPAARPEPAVRPAAPVRMIPAARCALCGRRFDEGARRYAVVSPQSVDRTLTVCHLCRKAVLHEGYRPAD